MDQITIDKIQILLKILKTESDRNYSNVAVIGGLDKFLQKWKIYLEPVIGDLPIYVDLSVEERFNWIRKVHKIINASTSQFALNYGQESSSKVVRKNQNKKLLQISLDSVISNLSSVSKKSAKLIQKMDILTVKDLIYFLPRRYNDFGNVQKISDLKIDQDQTIIANIWEVHTLQYGNGRRSTEVILGDDTGNIKVIWFNNPYLVRILKPNQQIAVSGRVTAFKNRLTFASPEYEVIYKQAELIHTGRIVPVYPTVDGLPQRTIRRIVKEALDCGIKEVEEFLPEDIRKRENLLNLSETLLLVHYPKETSDVEIAKKRLLFDQVLTAQLYRLQQKQKWQLDGSAIPLKIPDSFVKQFEEHLPYKFTKAQVNVINDILLDIEQKKPMSRLLQGEVGSGKTVVATIAMIIAVMNGYQAALMAPTEILAEQHFASLINILAEFGTVIQVNQYTVEINGKDLFDKFCLCLLVGSLTKKEKTNLHKMISENKIQLVIGTHAIIQDDVNIKNLALAVVDEQHRFGVIQRETIRKKEIRPHLLAMSATPIPRSLMLTIYGDLDVSTIDEMPEGRLPVETKWVTERQEVYRFIEEQVDMGNQAFIVYPLIDESNSIMARAATEEYKNLSQKIFPHRNLGLLHGKLHFHEKQTVMESFQKGSLDILVSTSVVEVGVDIPNATIMFIDGADRFGLAQLHQFRGRVGRGVNKSYCFVASDLVGPESSERLKIFEEIHDGFRLAEEDLRIRGPGSRFGTKQSGKELGVITADYEVIESARKESLDLLKKDPNLLMKEHINLAKYIKVVTKDFVGDVS